jgi:hypothetical protein
MQVLPLFVLQKAVLTGEQEFTMAMMLRTLNVDLDVIGYDKQQQIWVD